MAGRNKVTEADTQALHELAVLCTLLPDTGNVDNRIKDIRSGSDWSAIVRLATMHQVIPVLFRGITVLRSHGIFVPDEHFQYLQHEARKVLMKNMSLENELLRIAKLLQEKSIQFLAYKGPVLARGLYGNIGLRSFNDLDILIDVADFNNVKSVLENSGFKSIVDYNETGVKKIFKYEKEYTFVKEGLRGQRVEADIHWKLLSRFLDVEVALEDLLPYTESQDIQNCQLLVLRADYKVIALCLHHGGSDVWLKLKHILDFHMAVANIGSSEQWDFILQECERLRIRRMLHIGLHLVIELFGTQIPEHVRSAIDHDPAARKIAHRFATLRPPSEFSDWEILMRQLAMRKSTGTKAAILRKQIAAWIAPNSADQQFLPLPGADKLYPLYYLVKPFRLLFRGENEDKFE